jgi:hypothetical protein
MRFVIVIAELIGNLSMPGSGIDAGNLDMGSPVYFAVWEISVALLRSLPCCHRAAHILSAVAAQAVSRMTGGRSLCPSNPPKISSLDVESLAPHSS